MPHVSFISLQPPWRGQSNGAERKEASTDIPSEVNTLAIRPNRLCSLSERLACSCEAYTAASTHVCTYRKACSAATRDRNPRHFLRQREAIKSPFDEPINFRTGGSHACTRYLPDKTARTHRARGHICTIYQIWRLVVVPRSCLERVPYTRYGASSLFNGHAWKRPVYQIWRLVVVQRSCLARVPFQGLQAYFVFGTKPTSNIVAGEGR